MTSIYKEIPSILDYIKVYESTCREIEELSMEITMEADLNNETELDDDVKKKQRSLKFQETVKKIIDHIVSAIEKAMLLISNALNKVYLTDKGFKKQLYDATENHKPRTAIRLIMYQYVDEVLNTQYGRMKSIVNELITKIDIDDIEKLKDESNVLNKNHKELESYILKRLGCPNNVTDMSLYFLYIKKLFRGEKKETVIQNSQIEYYRKLVDGYDLLKKELERSKAIILTHARNMRFKITKIASNPAIQDEVKSKVIQHARNITCVYNMYSTFVGFMYQLKVEQMLSARIVLQKFYQF